MNFLGVIKKITPWIAAAATSGVPGLISMAATTVSKVVGKKVGSNVEDIAAAVAGATPEQIAALKAQDEQFQLQMQALGFTHEEELAKLTVEDRESARAREIALKDRIPAIMTIAVTVGFFSLLGAMMRWEPPAANKSMLDIMLGMLGAGWTGIISYYFGSSSGSQAKTDILGDLAGAKK